MIRPEVSPGSRRVLWRLFEDNKPGPLAVKVFELARQGKGVLQSFALDPFEDEWLDFARSSMAAHVQRCAGFVYAAANPVHRDLHKVGQTGKAVESRMKDLVKEGVFGHFELVHSVYVPDRFRAETGVHRQLAGTQRHKEFFKASYPIVAKAMDEVFQKEHALLAELGLTPLGRF